MFINSALIRSFVFISPFSSIIHGIFSFVLVFDCMNFQKILLSFFILMAFSETVVIKGPHWSFLQGFHRNRSSDNIEAIQRHSAMKMKLGCQGIWFMVFNAPFNRWLYS
jgi:hypothetical protein